MAEKPMAEMTVKALQAEHERNDAAVRALQLRNIQIGIELQARYVQTSAAAEFDAMDPARQDAIAHIATIRQATSPHQVDAGG